MIDIRQVTKVFKTKKQNITAVDKVDLHIKEGEIFGIIGYSGAGKSTLIRLLNGLEESSAGEIVVSGDDISKMSKSGLRQKTKSFNDFPTL